MPRNPDCTNCPLHQYSTHVCVWGTGAAPSKWMIVGMNPGAQEDRSGKPFVGPAGKELDEWLRAVGVDRTSVYITNAVKCRTDKNSEPSVKALEACRSYLEDELRTVNPEHILALGNTALFALTGKRGVERHRFRSLPLKGGTEPIVRVTYHPASVLRTASQRADAVSDVKLFFSGPSGRVGTVPFRLAERVHLHSERPAAYDIETEIVDLTKTRPRIDQIKSIQVSQGEEVCIYEAGAIPEAIRELKRHSRGVPVFGFNSAKFDDVVTGVESDDVILMSYLHREDEGHSLEEVACKYLGVEPWKHLIKEAEKEGNKEKFYEYGAKDANYTFRLWELFKAEREMPLYRHLLLPASRVAARMERRGLYLDPEAYASARSKYAALAGESDAALKRIAGDFGLHDFNPDSPKKVGDLLFKKLKLPILKWTESDNPQPCTDTGVLNQLMDEASGTALEAVKAERTYREANKLVSTYLDGFVKFCDTSHRIHPQYFLVSRPHRGVAGGTVTGRTSAQDPPIQTLPTKKDIRALVGSPPGKTLVLADYSQMEFRIAAWLSDEKELMAKYEQGFDAHTLTAAAIVGKTDLTTVTKEERLHAKPVNFGCLYGARAEKIQELALTDYGLLIPYSTALNHWKLFHSLYPGFRRLYADTAERVKRDKQVATPFGRVRHLPQIDSTNLSERAEALRQAINFRVQALANDIALLGLIELDKAGLNVVSFIHDGFIIEVEEGDAEWAGTLAKTSLEARVLESIEKHFHVQIPVPLVADISIAKNWG